MKMNAAQAGIALTFDDGPNPEHTPELLDILDEIEVTAHFFVVGKAVDERPHLAEEMHKRGHILCNHSYTHCRMTQKTVDEQKEEIEKCSEAIQRITGEKPRWFRPPYYDSNDDLIALVESYGMTSVFNQTGTADCRPECTTEMALEHLRQTQAKDAVVLCHEWSKPSREALRIWVPEMREQCAFGVLTAG